MAKYILVFGCLRSAWRFFVDLTRQLIKGAGSMPGGFVATFGWTVALAFYRDTMENFWSRDIFEVLQDFHQVIHIMPIYRSKIAEVKRFKQVALVKHGRFDCPFYFGYNFLCAAAKFAELAQHIPYLVFYLVVSMRSSNIGQVIFQSPYIGVDGHAVVIENDQQVGAADPCMV